MRVESTRVLKGETEPLRPLPRDFRVVLAHRVWNVTRCLADGFQIAHDGIHSIANFALQNHCPIKEW